MAAVFGGLIRVATLVWLAGHFTLTILYTFPINPIKMETNALLDATIGRFFQQNWSLFAPNPLTSDESLLARCLTAQEADHAVAERLPQDGWYDLSMPFWLRFQENRFSAYDRLVRPHTHALRQYLNGGVSLRPWYESCQKGWKDACEMFTARLKVVREASGRMLRRVGSAFCADIVQAGAYDSVAFRMRVRPGRPWSKRYTLDRPHRDVDVVIYPIESAIATTELYRVAGGR